MAAISEAKKRANKKWNDTNLKERYDRIQIVVPKGQKEIIQAMAEKTGESMNEYIKKAIAQRMEREAVPGVNPISPPAGESQDG